MRQNVSKATGAAVREAVDAKGITVDDLVGRTGIPRATLYRKLNGQASFTIEELAIIADVLDTTPGVLITRAESLAAA